MAFENASARTRGILATLPTGASMEDMLEHVARAQDWEQYTLVADAVNASNQATAGNLAQSVGQAVENAFNKKVLLVSMKP